MTRDLFADFGAFTLTGIALTPLDGEAGLYDHIYLGRTLEDLDRIDATGLTKGPKPREMAPEKLESLWTDLGSTDDAKVYLSTWTLVAASGQSLPYLKKQLQGTKATLDAKQVAQWIKDLDDDKPVVRERASHQLEKAGELAEPALRNAVETAPSLEALRRIERLLEAIEKRKDASAFIPERARLVRAVKVLELIGTPEAQQVFEELAKNASDARVVEEAKAALKRLGKKP